MKRCLSCMVFMGLATVLFADDQREPTAELDAKIARRLARNESTPASQDFVRSVWEDYKKAWQNPEKQKNSNGASSIFGKLPDAKNYDEYLGAYRRGVQDAAVRSSPKKAVRQDRPFIEILKDEQGRFYVQLEGHRIPAVLWNKTVVFTTGDIGSRAMPQFAEKPYGTLEMFMIIATEGKFYFAAPQSPSETWMPLSKIEKSETPSKTDSSDK